MNKTQIIDMIRTIKGTFVSFFSITLFVALGVAIFLGMGWAGTALTMIFQTEQDLDNFRDLEIISPYGLTSEDIEQIRRIDGVAEVEGTYNYYGYFNLGDVKYQARICTVPDKINSLFNLEGNLPARSDEVIVERNWAEKHDVKVGDTTTFKHDANEHPHALAILLENQDKLSDMEALLKALNDEPKDTDGMQALKHDSFTVSGLAESPEFISTFSETYGTSATLGTPVECIIFIPIDGFDARSFTGYSNVYVKSDYINGLYADEGIARETDVFKDRVNVVVKELTAAKNEKILNIANTLKNNLDNAPEQIEDYQRQLDQGNQTIELNEKLISESRTQLERGREMLDSGRNMLENAKSQVEDRVEQFESYKDKLDELFPDAKENLAKLQKLVGSPEELEELMEEYKFSAIVDNIPSYIMMVSGFYALLGNDIMAERYQNLAKEYDDFKTRLLNATGAKDYKSLAKKLPDLISRIRSALNMKDTIMAQAEDYIDELYESLDEAIQKAEESQAQLLSGQAQINSGQAQIDDGKKKIGEYQDKIDKAKELLESSSARQLRVATSNLKDYSSAILTRENNPSNASGLTFKEILSRVKFSLASLFLIVGILVCYSALSRIVYSHIKLLGTKKALGLNKGEITRSYLFYGALASIVGSALGVLAGYIVIQPIVLITIGKNYVFRNLVLYFSLTDALMICGIELAIILLSTFTACRSILKQDPVKLLAGPQPPSGKNHGFERTKLWGRLSLFSKTMFNNLFTDKRRVLGTLIGITGCTAMLVCGMAIKLDADRSPVIEFNELNKFDALILFDDKEEGCKDKIRAVLDSENIASSTFSSNYMRTVLPDGRVNICYLYVTDDDRFTESFLLKNDKGHFKELADGTRVCNGYADTYDIDPGDKIEFIDNTGQHFFIPYIGEFESYLPRIIMVMPADTYEKYSKADYRANSFTLEMEGIDRERLSAKLSEIPGFITLYDYLDANMTAFKAMSSAMTIISLVAVALAVIMAFLVLLNLLVMHVEEKKREMIILMINGYSVKDAKKYVYKDTIFLTAVGIILGAILGSAAASFNLRVFSYLPSHFYSGISWPAIAFGVVVAAFLALVNALIAMRRIKNFNLTDINK
ncbi:MAG: FtsX-like permease family protein [Lachnospiraceae bacterium]|nr:FtsX-like permease family protein [Lachnospiraceae bacterium]